MRSFRRRVITLRRNEISAMISSENGSDHSTMSAEVLPITIVLYGRQRKEIALIELSYSSATLYQQTTTWRLVGALLGLSWLALPGIELMS